MRTLVVMSCLALAACSPSARLDAIPIIDAHIHTDFTGQPERSSGLPFTLDEYLHEMRAADVVGAVAHTKRNGDGYIDLSSRNIIHCAGVDAQVAVARVEESLQSGKYRCIKIYLGYVHQFANDENYQPAYALNHRSRFCTTPKQRRGSGYEARV